MACQERRIVRLVEPTGATLAGVVRTLAPPRGGKGLERGRLPDLKNPEMNPTSTAMSVLFWLGLGAATFVILVLGYGTGFWG